MPPSPGLVHPPFWTDEQLAADRDLAIENFRRARMEVPLGAYLQAFEQRQHAVERLLATTVDLTEVTPNAFAVLTDPQLLEAFRYVAGPPVSLDDLKVVANVRSVSVKALEADPGLVQRLVSTVMLGLDQRRFPWIGEGRTPREDERRAAVLSSAALIASQRAATDRRSEGKTEQESMIESALLAAGYEKVETRTVNTIHEGPGPGEFCRESMLGTRKADVLVGLHDRRLAPIEAKVSNSFTNSIKRLNNDAAVKAGIWLDQFGTNNVVPTAVLSGVYKLKHLNSAQLRGLALFWAHDLAKLIGWIESTRR
jgi:hypothetical protein